MSHGPFKDQMNTHKRRYYTETENKTLPWQTISGEDCRDLTKKSVRENVGVVTKSPEGQTVLKSSKKGRYCCLPKKRLREGGQRKKVFLRSRPSRKGKGPVEGWAKKFAEGSDARRKKVVALAVGSRGDGGAVGTWTVASRMANTELKIDHCSKTWVVFLTVVLGAIWATVPSPTAGSKALETS